MYLAGLVLGTASTPARRTIVTFHEGLAWVAQLGLFLGLGLLVFPAELVDIVPEGAAIAFVTAAIARPAAAVVFTLGARFNLRERLMLGWAGLRGGTPIVFATFPVTELGGGAGHAVFQRRVLRRAALDGRAGHDDRAGRSAARRDLRRGGDPRGRWWSPCC